MKVLDISNIWGCPVTLPLTNNDEMPLKNEITSFSVLSSSPKKKYPFVKRVDTALFLLVKTSCTFSKARVVERTLGLFGLQHQQK